MSLRRRDGEAGSILLWVMVVGLFTLGSLGAMLRLIPSGMRYSLQDASTTYAFIVAESGIHFLMDNIHAKGPDILDDLEYQWYKLIEGLPFDGKFTITTDDKYVYITGSFGGATRTLRANLNAVKRGPSEPESVFKFDVAVYALAEEGARHPALSYTGGAKIYGKSGTNAVTTGAVYLNGGPVIRGEILVGPVPPEHAASIVSVPHWIDVEVHPGPKREYPLPHFSDERFRNLPSRGSVQTDWNKREIIIDSSGSYESIVAGSGNYTIVFDTKDSDLYVRTKTLKAHGAGKIEVRGTGRLFLYVDQSLDIVGGAALVHHGDPMKAVIFYAGSKTLALGGGVRFRGVIYVRDADVDIGGGFSAQAWILSGGRKVTFDGGANLGDVGIIYAPKANIDVMGGAVTGIVIGNSVHVSGGATLTHRPISFEYLPPELSFFEDPEEQKQDETLRWHLCWANCGPSVPE